jgi:hypothetical protein
MPPVPQQPSPAPIQDTQKKLPFFLIGIIAILIVFVVAGTAWAYRNQIFSLLSKNSPVASTTQPCYVVRGGKVFFTNGSSTVSPKSSYLVFGADPNSFSAITPSPLPAFGVGSVQLQGQVCYGKDAQHIFFERYVITGADVASFQTLSANPRYAKDANYVYRDGMRLYVKINAPSFTMLGDIYGKDVNNVYYDNVGDPNYEGFLSIPNSDPATFVSLGNYYGKDASAAYYVGQVISGVDAKSFTAPGCGYALDSKAVYRYGEVVSGVSPVNFTIPTSTPCDTDTARQTAFQQAIDTSGQSPYTVDANGVYYNSDQIVSNLENMGIPGPTPDAAPSLPGVDPTSFTTIKNDPAFGKDATHVYAGVSIVAGADPVTFQLLSRFYGKDATHVYVFWPTASIVVGVDPDTFVVLDDPFGSNNGEYTGALAKDKNHVYSQGQVIPGDPATFTILNQSYNEDASHVYMGTTTVSSSPSTFWGDPDGNFAEDGNTIYYSGTPIAGVDAATFSVQRTYPYFYGIDSKNVYYIGYQSPLILTGADPASFVVIDDSNDQIKYEAMDKNHFYYDDKIVK